MAVENYVPPLSFSDKIFVHWVNDRMIMIHCRDLVPKSEIGNLTRPRGELPFAQEWD